MTFERSTQTTGPFVGSDFHDTEFVQIRQLLLERRGFDLGMYKDQCIRRRIASRVRVCGLHRAEDYIALLERNEAEVDALLSAVSIHVSQFFRNPHIFALLEKDILPQLIRSALQRSTRQLKIWSVGCAAGEEPYSLALLLDELVPAELNVDILGTDISAPVLAQAVVGQFDPHRLTEVPEESRERYFADEGRYHRLCERIRRKVRFAEHNILSNNEYPAADLILCRNVMIYFSREDQERILTKFAGALSPGGTLVLGNTESILGESRQWFSPIYPAERIYRRR